MTKLSNKSWILIFVSIILICLIFVLMGRKEDITSAEIYVDGELVKTISDLHPQKEENFNIQTEWGENVIAVYEGKVWVKSSDCKNQTCVNFGKISTSGTSIICAPHRLVVKLVGDEKTDLVV